METLLLHISYLSPGVLILCILLLFILTREKCEKRVSYLVVQAGQEQEGGQACGGQGVDRLVMITIIMIMMIKIMITLIIE